MINQNYQERGYGSKAFDTLIEYIRTMPCGNAEYICLSFEEENAQAEAIISQKDLFVTGNYVKMKL